MDFVKMFREGLAAPEGAEGGAPFNPFLQPTDGSRIAQPAKGPSAIPGMTEYAIDFYCQRFYIGRQLAEIAEGGQKLFEDRDESAAYQHIVNMSLRGEAIILNRAQSTTSDGSVVIWLEWGVYKNLKKQSDATRTYLTQSEIVSPRHFPTHKGKMEPGDAAPKEGEQNEYFDEDGLPRTGPPPLPAAEAVDYDDVSDNTAVDDEPDW